MDDVRFLPRGSPSYRAFERCLRSVNGLNGSVLGILLACAGSGNIRPLTLLISLGKLEPFCPLHGMVVYLGHVDIFGETTSDIVLLWHTNIS